METTSLLPSYLNEALVRSALEHGLEYPKRVEVGIHRFVIRVATSAGDNYLSDVFRAWVRYNRSRDDDNIEEASLIVKCMPDTGFRGPVIGQLNAFEKEVDMFRDVVPALSKFVNGEMFAARLFHATTDPVRMIIFQDLNALGFTMADRTQGGLDYNHCALIMRKIASFHAASMILANSSTAKETELERQFEYGFINPHIAPESNTVLHMLIGGLDTLIECSEKHWVGFDREIVAKLKKMKPTYKDRIATCLNQKFTDGFKVLNHGDLWINNIMFQYDAGGAPKDVVFVDYQLSCYTSPGVDLNYSLINCPTFDVRERQSDDLVGEYHRKLASTLVEGGFSKVPSLDQVQREIKRMRYFSFIAAVGILPIVMMESTSEVDISFDAMLDEEKSKKLRLCQYNGERYRKSITALLEKFNREGLLDSVLEVIPKNTEVLAYADDLLLMARNPFPEMARRRLQEGISALPAKVQVPEYLNEDLIKRSLANGFQNDSVTVKKLQISPATSAGDNYMSEVFRIHVEYRDALDTDEVKQISLIVKCMPDGENRGEVIEALTVYEKEAEMFINVIPQLSKIARGAFFAAKCYYATRDPERMLVFHDLKSLDYTMANRHAGLDFDHCALIMKKIGKFHAASMRYAEKNMDVMGKYFHFSMFNPDVGKRLDCMDVIFGKGFATLIDIAEAEWEDFDPKILAKMKRLLPVYVSKLEECLGQKFDDGFKVLNHGDLWCNNMLFKHSVPSGKVEDVVFVDYQISYYSSPGIDLNYALSNCPDRETRKRTDELINIYYQSLSETLKQIEYSRIPTLADVLREIERMEFFALVSVISVLPIVMMEKTDSFECNFDAFYDEEIAEKVRRIQFGGKMYQSIVKPMLKRFDERNLLDV
ncbi:uncharacterized protein LOC129761507 [Toxorhynchites rutilus septentrionalis]|uniref:uncharacterized protein LOC129761507 n=1 Tax=Toxorhynchites rutilus septentrionalis TaxID=329112 RepID=UPI002479BBFA|nr:uncharacterized protein LOC129761507 [Toxorhynchites rutilus septentrionalis]